MNDLFTLFSFQPCHSSLNCSSTTWDYPADLEIYEPALVDITSLTRFTLSIPRKRKKIKNKIMFMHESEMLNEVKNNDFFVFLFFSE